MRFWPISVLHLEVAMRQPLNSHMHRHLLPLRHRWTICLGLFPPALHQLRRTTASSVDHQ
jgi:hypothetical protein